MDEDATVPGGASGELRWPPTRARKRPEEKRADLSLFTFK